MEYLPVELVVMIYEELNETGVPIGMLVCREWFNVQKHCDKPGKRIIATVLPTMATVVCCNGHGTMIVQWMMRYENQKWAKPHKI